VYADNASKVEALLPAAGANFKNPFDKTSGSGAAWLDVATYPTTGNLTTGSTVSGIVAYSDNATTAYQVAGRGKTADLALVLSSGQ